MSRGSEGFLLRVSRLAWHGFALRSEKLPESCSLGLASGKSLALGNLGLPAATAQGLEAAEGAAWAEHETLRRYEQPGSAHATSAWRAPLGPWPTPPDPSLLSAAVAAPGDTFRNCLLPAVSPYLRFVTALLRVWDFSVRLPAFDPPAQVGRARTSQPLGWHLVGAQLCQLSE